MLRSLCLSVALFAAFFHSHVAGADVGKSPNAVYRCNFENGFDGWKNVGRKLENASANVVRNGDDRYVEIVDENTSGGVGIETTDPIPVKMGAPYRFEAEGKMLSGTGVVVNLFECSQDGQVLLNHMVTIGGDHKDAEGWVTFGKTFFATQATASVKIRIQTWGWSRGHGLMKAFRLRELTADDFPRNPPFEPQYRLKPSDRLTPADVAGPDGVVYPDWSRAGIPGGIPTVAAAARIEDYGGVAGDDKDDSGALLAACQAAAAKGGGAVVLGEGVYHLDYPVNIVDDDIVIRGLGREKTKLIFRYTPPETGCFFPRREDGTTIYANTVVEFHAPAGYRILKIMAGGKVLKQRKAPAGTNNFKIDVRGEDIINACGEGEVLLEGVVEYRTGEVKQCSARLNVRKGHEAGLQPRSEAAICFLGKGFRGVKTTLAKDGARGESSIDVADAAGFKAGDYAIIKAPNSGRWKKLTRNTCKGEWFRFAMVKIVKVTGQTLYLEQPLRIDYPTADGSYIETFALRKRCGIEDLYIEHQSKLWMNAVLFRYAGECWARGVTVKKCGRNPIYAMWGKNHEIRDCVFDDSWFKKGGGTAYAGWEFSWDCLMDGVTTHRLRHAPVFQWGTGGCVIRNSTFMDSDAQWHAGWTRENLLENCVVRSRTGNGSYGYGMWASPPEDRSHGPNGPRNVVYNCDIAGQKDGVWLGGMNESWLFLHNRFVVEKGYGIFVKDASFDHLIEDNCFVLRNPSFPMAGLATPDCRGIDLKKNRVYGGNGKINGGLGTPASNQDNVVLPLGNDLPPRPRPAVPSIFEWQRLHIRNANPHNQR
jgi:hypothetical protein